MQLQRESELFESLYMKEMQAKREATKFYNLNSIAICENKKKKSNERKRTNHHKQLNDVGDLSKHCSLVVYLAHLSTGLL